MDSEAKKQFFPPIHPLGPPPPVTVITKTRRSVLFHFSLVPVSYKQWKRRNAQLKDLTCCN